MTALLLFIVSVLASSVVPTNDLLDGAFWDFTNDTL